jgi:hypothetical protein
MADWDTPDGLLDESDPLDALLDAYEVDVVDAAPVRASVVVDASIDDGHASPTVPTHTTGKQCAVCGVSAVTKCAQCGLVYYCSRQHQKQAWRDHKTACAPPVHPKVSRQPAPSPPADGTVVGTTVYVNGLQYPLSRWLHFTTHQGAEVALAFRQLSPVEKVEALVGRRQVLPVLSPHLPPGCPRGDWCGYNGTRCNGCGLVRAKDADFTAEASEPVGFDPAHAIICTRCRYTACMDCAEHYGRGQCFCKDSNFGTAYPPPQQRSAWETGFW